jgi:REP element-mobilizing transposase RayT
MDETRKRYAEIDYVQRNTQPDLIHLVVCFPPKYSISMVVQILKKSTGKRCGRSSISFGSDIVAGEGFVGWMFCEHRGLGNPLSSFILYSA